MQFVNDRLGKRAAEGSVVLPIVGGGIGDHALHCPRRVVARPARGGAIVAVRHGNCPAIGIEQHLFMVEPDAPARCKRAVGAKRIDLSRLQSGHHRMPVVIRAVVEWIERDHRRRRRTVGLVKQQELDRGGVPGKDAEVDAGGGDGSTERRRPTGLDGAQGHHFCDL